MNRGDELLRRMAQMKPMTFAALYCAGIAGCVLAGYLVGRFGG